MSLHDSVLRANNICEWSIDVEGNFVGSEFLLGTRRKGNQTQSHVVSDAQGKWAAIWTGSQAGEGWEIIGRRFDSDDQGGKEFDVNQQIFDQQFVGGGSVGMDRDGNLFVAWADHHRSAITVRRFDHAGNMATDELQLPSGQQASVAVDGNGNIVVTWLWKGSGVYAQRFTPSFNQTATPEQAHRFQHLF